MGWLTMMDPEWEHIKHFVYITSITILFALYFIAASIMIAFVMLL